jgi:hypothetical protein
VLGQLTPVGPCSVVTRFELSREKSRHKLRFCTAKRSQMYNALCLTGGASQRPWQRASPQPVPNFQTFSFTEISKTRLKHDGLEAKHGSLVIEQSEFVFTGGAPDRVLGQLTPEGPRQCALHPGGDAGPGGGYDWRGGHGAEAGQHAGAAGGPILLAGEAAGCLSSCE